jgi:AcrR family transcriptional regulator
MARATVKEDRNDVRKRLLRTGLRLFSQKGFDGATVREICDEAESNLAAINYYFGDKTGYFQSVRAYARDLLHEITRDILEDQVDADPWGTLRRHISVLLSSSYDNTLFQAARLRMRELLDIERMALFPKDDAEEQQRVQFDGQITRLMSALLGPEAATPRNLTLLRYTYFSMSLFLIIQNHLDEHFQGDEGIRLSALVTRDELADFILATIRRSVHEMQHPSPAQPPLS